MKTLKYLFEMTSFTNTHTNKRISIRHIVSLGRKGNGWCGGRHAEKTNLTCHLPGPTCQPWAECTAGREIPWAQGLVAWKGKEKHLETKTN